MSFGGEDYDFLFRVILIGDSGVGKSNLLSRYTKNEFSETTRQTIGVEFGTRSLQINGKTIRVQIWDTAGEERYRAMSKNYYRGAHAAIVVYDITKRETFESVNKWLTEVKASADPDVVVMMVGNKCDLKHLRSVQVQDAKAFAESEELMFMETSAMAAVGVQEAFEQLVQEVYRKNTRHEIATGDKPAIERERGIPLDKEPPAAKKRSCCG